VDALSFPAVQTYSDGEVVKWDQVAKDGADEPEHPAPTLKLAAAITPVAATTTPESSTDPVARWLGAGGLLIGLLGLGFALWSRRTASGKQS
jgi:hypothetical protein